jgi:peroxiredoxin
MRPLFFIPLPVYVAASFCLLHLGSSISYAQSNTLEHCLETMHRTRKAINERRMPNQQTLFPVLDPTYQKLQQNYDNWAECIKGQKAPLSAFQTLDGESYDMATLSGKVLVVNFWFMSCAPCVAEMPALNKLVKEYKGKNVLFLGFSSDKAASLKPAFFENHPFDFKIIADARNIIIPFHTNSFPTTYIVDQRGIIHQAWIGFVGNGMDSLAPYHKAKSAIDDLLTTANK